MKKAIIRISIVFTIATAMMLAGCSKFLDVVPDNTSTVDKMFENKSKILQALATCYSYMPDDFNDHYRTSVSLGNEIMFPLVYANRTDVFITNRVMCGEQSVDTPYYSYWDGSGYVRSLYEGIRYCNIFLNNISNVPDLESGDCEDYIAQVKFLKAYYHFILINSYGPIIIADDEMDMNASEDEIHQYRQDVDKCFEYVVNLLDEVIDNLPATRVKTMAGQITKPIAAALKAKVLLYWASPLFNGNAEFYSGFTNPETGKPFFNTEYNAQRWADAALAAKEAIKIAEDANIALYTYTKSVPDIDVKDFNRSGVMQYAYNARYTICDPWNQELIWGYSNVNPQNGASIQAACQVKNIEYPTNYSYSYAYMSATQNVVDKFYTKNGVPINEDRNFDYDNKFELVNLPTDDYHRGYFIDDDQEQTVKEYLDREPRFYGWIATDRSVWRTYGMRYNMRMRFNEAPGGGNSGLSGEYYQTGIAIKKWVHPETQNMYWERIMWFPFPLIRLSDLYLMYAEAVNESEGPCEEAYKYIDLVRAKYNLPKVEDVWANGEIVKTVGKHATKEGLREIIHHERAVELCFEGHQYNDIRRWKEADIEFNEPIMGWDSSKGEIKDFYRQTNWQSRTWVTPRDYFTPLANSILNKNPNLVQNFGW